MRILPAAAAIATALSLACHWSPAGPSGPSADTGTYTGSYSYRNKSGGPNVISGTLSFVVVESNLSQIRNIHLVMNGCQSANVQVESVLVPDQQGPPGRGDGWFTIFLNVAPNQQVAINCDWNQTGQPDQAMCGMAVGLPCGAFGGSAKDYGFLVSKQAGP
jgi:hypothetical protein